MCEILNSIPNTKPVTATKIKKKKDYPKPLANIRIASMKLSGGNFGILNSTAVIFNMLCYFTYTI